MVRNDASAEAPVQEADAVIVGAGPVGLFQVFELGLLGIHAHVVDSLPYPGGQPMELYPDKPIYDIPAVPVCTGRELTSLLLKQIEPFKPVFHLEHEARDVHRQHDGRFLVTTSQGTRLMTRTLFIAGGVGAFHPRTLKLPGLDPLLDRQAFYRVRDPAAFAGKKLVIVGGGDSALDWAIYFATHAQHRAASVMLVPRREHFRAAPASVARVRELCGRGALALHVGQVTSLEVADGRLQGVAITDRLGVIHHAPADGLLMFLGMSPKLGPIAEWGFDIQEQQLVVDTRTFSTNVPGVFAVGDINAYPGKKKLILSGFHECALAAFGAAAILFPERTLELEYTTTSPELHRALGVASPPPD